MHRSRTRALASILSPAGRRGRLAVFCFHQVLEKKDPLRPDEPCRAEFCSDLEVIKSVFNILPVPEAAKRLADGTLPARAACITFDDGYLNNYELAAPILEDSNVPATFFVASGAVDTGIMWNDLVIETFSRSSDRPTLDSDVGLALPQLDQWVNSAIVGNVLAELKYKPLDERWNIAQRLYNTNVGGKLPRLMMTRDMVCDLQNRGFDIGGHTVNHPILQKLPDDCARQEIENSLKWIEDVTGRRPVTFAYPNGKPGIDFSERHTRMVAEAGCSAAFSTDWSLGKNTSNVFSIPRIGPWWRAGRTLSLGLLRLYGSSYAH